MNAQVLVFDSENVPRLWHVDNCQRVGAASRECPPTNQLPQTPSPCIAKVEARSASKQLKRRNPRFIRRHEKAICIACQTVDGEFEASRKMRPDCVRSASIHEGCGPKLLMRSFGAFAARRSPQHPPERQESAQPPVVTKTSIDTRPKTDPFELLAKFLQAFDLDRAREKLTNLPLTPDPKYDKEIDRIRKLAENGMPEDAGSSERHAREVEAMADVLVELLKNARNMLELPPGKKRNELQRAIVKLWNDSLTEQGIVSLPTLCEMCGLPVLRRRTQKIDGIATYPIVCDEACQNARAKRRKRETAKNA